MRGFGPNDAREARPNYPKPGSALDREWNGGGDRGDRGGEGWTRNAGPEGGFVRNSGGGGGGSGGGGSGGGGGGGGGIDEANGSRAEGGGDSDGTGGSILTWTGAMGVDTVHSALYRTSDSK